MYDAGASFPEIEAAAGVSEATAHGIVRRVRPADPAAPRTLRRRTRRTFGRAVRWADRPNRDEIDAAIRSEYPAAGPAPIVARFGLTNGVVGKRAWQLGVRSLTTTARKADTFAARNVSVDQGFFRTWSPNLAWLLGYIWTDGTISYGKGQNRVGFRCAVTDEHIIHDIRRAIGATSPVERFPPAVVRGRYVGQPQVGFRINSVAVVRVLVEEYGLPPNKSNTDPPFPRIPDEHFAHFSRGVTDGDGTICRTTSGGHRVVVLGSHRFVDEIRHRIAASCGVRLPNLGSRSSSERLSVIGWYARGDVVRLARWLYPPGEYLHLSRKRLVAESILAGKPAATSGIRR